jgi:O-acetyl-ADP-ribose deacetylase (regulator of RNase III)
LQSKKAFPDNYLAYVKACQKGEVQPGHLFVYKTNNMFGPKFIINFPTKRHWKDFSRYEDIAAGLSNLNEKILEYGIKSVAIPPLGCGLGGLDWQKVRPMISEALSGLKNVDIHLYEPAGTPNANHMPVRTKHPRMTIARALFIKLIEQYNQSDYRLTLLEIQKLAYFLQESGINLRLNYVKLTYGPYAHNLNKVLEVLEGHYTRGYGDNQKPDVEIRLLPGATTDADKFIQKNSGACDNLERVAALVEGFETPYGMEILASVHWVMVHDHTAKNSEEAITQVHRWNERKAQLLKSQHIKIAWDRLASQGWFPSN